MTDSKEKSNVIVAFDGEKDSPIKGVYESRCKLCSLSKTHPELVDIVHQWRFGSESKSYRDIAEELNRILERDQIKDVKPFVISNFVAHFNEHVPADAALIYELQEKASKKRKRTPADPDILHRATQVKRESLEKIEANLVRWQKVYESIYNTYGLDNLDAKGMPAPLDIPDKDAVDAMAKAHATWSDLLTAKERLLKERTFTLEVVQQAVDHYGRNFVAAIAERAIKARDEAKSKSPAYADEAEALFQAFADAIKEASTELYDSTLKEIGDRFNI